MVLNTVRANSYTQMETTTKASLSMECLKAAGSTCGGKKAATLKETLNRDSEAGMASGIREETAVSSIRDTIIWTKSQAMVFTSGTTDGPTKATLTTTIATAMENSMIARTSLCIEASGKMDNKQKKNM